ncbi:MAG: hypothetical protein ABW156_11070 [Jiangellaceae bacterium]
MLTVALAQNTASGGLGEAEIFIVVLLVMLSLAFAKRALRPLKEIIIPIAAAGLAIFAAGAAVVLLLLAAAT